MWPLFAQEQTSKDWSNVIDELARTPLSRVLIFVAICSIVRFGISPILKRIPPHRRTFGYTALLFCNEALDAIIYAGVFVFLLIRPFGIQAFKIPSPSMVPTLLTGDFIVANKALYRYSDPKVGDIIVFRPPKWACTPDQLDSDGEVNVDFIKRCQGVPGDVVEVRNGTLYRNGKSIVEPYIAEHMNKDFKLVFAPGQKLSTAGPSPAKGDPRSEYWPLQMSGANVNNDSGYTASPYLIMDDLKLQDTLRNLPPAKIPPGYYLMMGDNRNNSFDGRSWGLVPRDDIIARSEFIWMPVSRWGLTRSNSGSPQSR